MTKTNVIARIDLCGGLQRLAHSSNQTDKLDLICPSNKVVI